jgi:hypothetical protein
LSADDPPDYDAGKENAILELTAEQQRAPETLEQHFRRLANAWKAGRSGLTTAKRMAAHPAYHEIIALGEPVVPLIIAEMEREPDHWFIALHAITGASPVPDKARGNLADMARAWADWWRGKAK